MSSRTILKAVSWFGLTVNVAGGIYALMMPGEMNGFVHAVLAVGFAVGLGFLHRDTPPAGSSTDRPPR